MHKRIVAVIVAVGLVFSLSSRSFAEPSLNDQLNSSQSQYDKSKKDIDIARSKANDATIKAQKLDAQIRQGTKELDSINIQISKTQADISSAEESIKKAETDIKSEQELYDKRMRAMYMSGSSGYVSVILESNGLDDLMTKIDTVQKMTEMDHKIISELNDKKEGSSTKKDQLVVDQQKFNSLKNDGQQKLDVLNKQKAEQIPIIAQSNAEEQAAISASAAAQAQIASINKKLADLKAAEAAAAKAAQQQAAQSAQSRQSAQSGQAQGSSNGGGVAQPAPGPVAVNANGDRLVAYAASFIGVQYVLGGTSPSGFDCSGLMQYVYAHFGISISRTSQEQFNDGMAVDISQLQPGDLVFFAGSDGTVQSPGHVGMYVGGGMMIEAPHTGCNVRYASISRSGYAGARRIIR